MIELSENMQDQLKAMGWTPPETSSTVVITEEDRNAIHYFIVEKGDIERWGGWEEKKAAIFSLWPALRTALDDVENADRTLLYVADRIENNEL